MAAEDEVKKIAVVQGAAVGTAIGTAASASAVAAAAAAVAGAGVPAGLTVAAPFAALAAMAPAPTVPVVVALAATPVGGACLIAAGAVVGAVAAYKGICALFGE